MEPIIEVKGLKKYFQTPRGLLHAVDDVTFSIERGKTLGVVGESGCGKSTLGRTIIHLLESTGGQIFLEGKDITNVKGKELKQVREKMQIIFQDPSASLDPRMTVGEIIGEALDIHKLFPKFFQILVYIVFVLDKFCFYLLFHLFLLFHQLYFQILLLCSIKYLLFLQYKLLSYNLVLLFHHLLVCYLSYLNLLFYTCLYLLEHQYYN